jgi:hypothetical protein
MKKGLFLGFCVLGILILTSSLGFSWGSATHAYIADRIGAFFPLMNSNELYGIMGPDLFNYSFDPTINYMNPILAAYTHGLPGQEGFMDVWKNASWWGYQKNVAYGYVAHNDLWGADFTAHHQERSYLPKGYIIRKAEDLNVLLDTDFLSLGMPDYGNSHDLRIELCHNLVETAGDILIKKADALIGEKILTASLLRTSDFPGLLQKAILPAVPDPFKELYKTAIIENEKAFRQMMVSYGGILILAQDQIISAFSDQMTTLGVQYVKVFAGIDLNPVLVRPIVEKAIRKSMDLCKNDYLPEIQYTINFVKNQLWSHGVRY